MVAALRRDGHAQFGTMTAEDAAFLRRMGTGHNLPGALFTVDGRPVHFPSTTDRFPDIQTNVVPIQLSMGAYNCLQQSDCHAYWEFNYQTNWIHPLYELPFTGDSPTTSDALRTRCKTARSASSIHCAGLGAAWRSQRSRVYGDNPNRPRDPDLFDADNDAQREFRRRFIPSGLANEILLDVYVRRSSFMPHEHDLTRRLYHAYAAEVRRVDSNSDGVISAAEGDIDSASDGSATIHDCSCPRPRSTVSRLRAKSTMGCSRRSSPQASVLGYCKAWRLP